jgi:hypothetical protein
MQRRTLQARRRQPIRWLKSGSGGASLCVVSIGSTFAVYIYLEIRQSINWRNIGPKFPGFLWIGDVGWGYILRTSLQTAFPCGDALLSRTADIYRFIDLAGLLYGASAVNPTHYQMTPLGI